MTATGGPDLSGVPASQLLAEIPKDHAAATAAGIAQSETLDAMGQKVAEIRVRTGMSWRAIAAETGLSVRTVRRHAEPYLPPKT
jgi:DNA-binding NarL/FixJ family response regulator